MLHDVNVKADFFFLYRQNDNIQVKFFFLMNIQNILYIQSLYTENKANQRIKPYA